jgi:hypothetical protein
MKLTHGRKNSRQAQKFFLKKEPKTLLMLSRFQAPGMGGAAGNGKSFLFLFFKKETLPFCLSSFVIAVIGGRWAIFHYTFL